MNNFEQKSKEITLKKVLKKHFSFFCWLWVFLLVVFTSFLTLCSSLSNFTKNLNGCNLSQHNNFINPITKPGSFLQDVFQNDDDDNLNSDMSRGMNFDCKKMDESVDANNSMHRINYNFKKIYYSKNECCESQDENPGRLFSKKTSKKVEFDETPVAISSYNTDKNFKKPQFKDSKHPLRCRKDDDKTSLEYNRNKRFQKIADTLQRKGESQNSWFRKFRVKINNGILQNILKKAELNNQSHVRSLDALKNLSKKITFYNNFYNLINQDIINIFSDYQSIIQNYNNDQSTIYALLNQDKISRVGDIEKAQKIVPYNENPFNSNSMNCKYENNFKFMVNKFIQKDHRQINLYNSTFDVYGNRIEEERSSYNVPVFLFMILRIDNNKNDVTSYLVVISLGKNTQKYLQYFARNFLSHLLVFMKNFLVFHVNKLENDISHKNISSGALDVKEGHSAENTQSKKVKLVIESKSDGMNQDIIRKYNNSSQYDRFFIKLANINVDTEDKTQKSNVENFIYAFFIANAPLFTELGPINSEKDKGHISVYSS
ncbi:hypothetical protein EDEG_00432 [Edhazardia aedis USNM 41457]|uniref:Uncharacterized protein n=1 Tax=Edhazardia aedis (strain USNM 41457) TaxID=1003232 RepID=J8ZP79_EDHAE|nr:hypothetical protein EDEG_00432 [Edhazardia aedis USNM 41457]|eukprot:EJW01518.1 hypothetical protein EDEG_00432 [Edhazardia aedis USNM 41457]